LYVIVKDGTGDLKFIDIETIGGPHKIPREELEIIEKDMKDPIKSPQPRYKAGEMVYLQKDVEEDGYTIPKYSLCWVEQILIMLEKNEKDENIYKVHYVLLFDYVNDEEIFNDMYADKDENFFREKEKNYPEYNFKPAPPGDHIMFSVNERDISNSNASNA
jgi:hypothetical protein